MTKYGKSILEIINNSTAHPTAEQIFFKLREQYPSVAMATVYNNLKSLYEDHRIRKISIEGQTDRYDKTLRHDHLVCRGCGKISDLWLKDMKDDLSAETGVDVDGYDLVVYYLCPECRSRQLS